MANPSEIAQAFLSGNGNVNFDESGNIVPQGNEISNSNPDAQEMSQEDSQSDSLFNMDDLNPNSELENSEVEKPEVKSEQKAPKANPNREKITITDDKGRRQIEIDYTNKEQIKKFAQMAHGARKWQAERDSFKGKTEELSKKNQELQGNWDYLEKTFQDKGISGVIDLLQGREGAYTEWVKSEVEKQKFMEKASPEEIQALQERELAEKNARELERIRRDNEKFREEMQKTKEESDLNVLRSQINPVFDKYRFADKLGDPTGEHMFDEMLWNTTLKRLETFEEKGIDLTPEIIDKEFRQVSMGIKKRISTLAEKKTGDIISQTKSNSTSSVQSKLKSGYNKENSTTKEARDLINNGDLTGLLKGWNKYGSLFGSGRG